MLRLENVEAHYGNIRALKEISIDISPGEIATIIGANGAGKTTTLKTICGLVPASSGRIYFQGKDITHTHTADIVDGGIAMVPEGRRVFPKMSVLENLQLGAYLNRDKNAIKEDLHKVNELFPILKDRRKQVAGTLSGGEQQMLAVGRALMSGSRFLLLDEPSMGLAPLLMFEKFRTLKRLNEEGLSILLIEQNARIALKFAHRGYVLDTGEIVAQGTSEQLANDPDVKKAYLGG